MNQQTFGIIFVLISKTVFCYEISEPKIDRLTPQGLRVSIPDEAGIRYFAFHANVNKPININENGEIVGEVSRSRDNRWIYEDENIVLQPTDILHYWIYVQANENAHKFQGNENQQETRITTTNRMSDTSNSECKPSITTIRGKLAACKDHLIFEEQFNEDLGSQERINANRSFWTREIFMPLDPDYEFCAYRELEKNVDIAEGILQIIPVISDAEYGDNATLFGKLNLGELCTGLLPAECSRNAIGYSILPPVVSARLTTKQSFHFRYGKIEIRAKFPKGDWIYPELWLEPKYKRYGSGYSSGRVILGMARGNDRLIKLTRVSNMNLGSSLLEFGLRTGPNNDVRNNMISKEKEYGTWIEDYHVYTTIWDQSGFSFQVDGEDVGRIDPPPKGWLNSNQSPGYNNNNNNNNNNNDMSPYDNEFYITLGLGVGGIRIFPDWITSGNYGKPWSNVGAKAMLNFWQGRDTWLPSWKDKSSDIHAKLQVDYVKVWTV